MQSKVSYSSHYRAPAAARLSAPSLIPSRHILRPSTERWAGPPAASQKTVDSRRVSVRDGADSGQVSGSIEKSKEVVVYEVRFGVVKDTTSFGVFVDIGADTDGLLHISQISSKRMRSDKDIRKIFSAGDYIKVMVLSVDKDGRRQRILLSTKSLEVNPGDMVKNPQLVYSMAEEAAAAFRATIEAPSQDKEGVAKRGGQVDPNLKVHELRSGVVQSVKKHGIFVDIGAGCLGMLHGNQVSHEIVSTEAIEKMFSVGDEIKVMIHHIDYDQQRILLSTRSLEVNPGDVVKDPQLVYSTAEVAAAAFRASKQEAKVDPNLKVHELRSGVVQSASKNYVFVDIGAGPVGLLRKNQISHESVKDMTTMFSVGDEIKVMVHEIDSIRQRITLSTKSLEVDPGDMVKDPQLVYSTAEKVAAAFRAKFQRVG